MPSNKQRIVGAVASVALTVGGAWLASMADSSGHADAQMAFESGIRLSFDGIRNDAGNIIVMVFADRASFKAFDASNAVGYREVAAKRGSVSVAFPALKSGPLAVAAFHDEDGDQDMDMAGEWPSEGYATSGAIDAYDTPTFAAASLRSARPSMTMHYPN